MRPIISSAPPAGSRQPRTSAVSRGAASPARREPTRGRRSYMVYGSDVSSDAMPGLQPAETYERPRVAVRREPFGVRLRSFIERNGISTMWNPSFSGTDLTLVMIVGILLALGLVMVYSANIGEGTLLVDGQTQDHWFKLQLKWAAVGVVGLLFFWRVRYTFWRHVSVHMMLLTAGLLVLVMLLNFTQFGLARSLLRNGSIQPAELAKLVMILYMADWLSSKGAKLRQFSLGLLPFTVMVGAFSALIAGQKVSTAFLLAITAIAMFLVAGADIKQIGLLMIPIVGVFLAVSSFVGYVRDRLATFMAAFRDPAQATQFQIRQFMESLQAGGLFGVGLGKGTIKDWLPVAHSDSIFAVIGEELGLLGCVVVIGLFMWLGYRGILISLRRRDGYGALVAFGVSVWLITQALIHIGVVTVTVPPTGIPLPFISYGGTALVTALAGVGLLLSISCSVESGAGEEGGSAGSDVRGRDGRPRVPRPGSRGSDVRAG